MIAVALCMELPPLEMTARGSNLQGAACKVVISSNGLLLESTLIS